MSLRTSVFVPTTLWLLALGTVPPAEALDVLVFNSTRYVDSGQVGYPEGSQESDNIQAALAALSHHVTPIAGPNDPTGSCPPYSQPGTLLATAAQYSAALAVNTVFLIPEQESWCSMPAELYDHLDIVSVWRNWVANGGGLVIHSSKEAKTKVDNFFFLVFGFRAGPPVDGANGTLLQKTPAAASTHFASGPATITVNESTGLLPLTALPAGSVSIYDNGTNAGVAIIPFGSGKIVFLGWDWTHSDPPFTGTGATGGWFPQVLDGAVKTAAGVAPPGSHSLTVHKSGTGTGSVASAPAGIDCGATCAVSYPGDTAVTLTATPAAGSLFEGWSGAGCSGTATCGVTLSADLVVTATFTAQPSPPVVTLDLDANPDHVGPGDTLHVDLAVANSGPTRPVDVYFGVLLPADAGPRFGCPRGDAIAFLTGSSQVVMTCASSPASTFVPMFRGVTLPGGMSRTEVPDFWSVVWQAGLPAGTYTVFAAMTAPNAFSTGQVDSSELLAVAVRGVVASP